MEMLSSLRGDKHEFCLVVIEFKHHLYMTAQSEVAQIFLYRKSSTKTLKINAMLVNIKLTSARVMTSV